MGNFIQKQAEWKKEKTKQQVQEHRNSLTLHLKTKNINDMRDVVEYISNVYSQHSLLSQEEFEDIFGIIFDDLVDQAFEALKAKKTGKVDLYEGLAVLALLNGDDDFEGRIAFIFKLFDFDGSGSIEKKEFVMSCTAAIIGLSKIAHVPLPTLKEIEDFAVDKFFEIDNDENNVISQQELQSFLSSDLQLQEFLLIYCNVNTFALAEHRFNTRYNLFLDLFKQSQINSNA